MKSYLGKGKEKDVKGGKSWGRKNMWGIKICLKVPKQEEIACVRDDDKIDQYGKDKNCKGK